jgi:hypothetical protein
MRSEHYFRCSAGKVRGVSHTGRGRGRGRDRDRDSDRDRHRHMHRHRHRHRHRRRDRPANLDPRICRSVSATASVSCKKPGRASGI